MRKRLMVAALVFVVLVLLYMGSFAFSYDRLWRSRQPLLMTDVARLLPQSVHRVATLNTEEEMKRVLADARAKGLKVSISGSRHSQGGHTYYPDAVVLDMTSHNKVLSLDRAKKVIRVQSGAKWRDVQKYINPYGLAVKVMQSSNIFTIGGTLSANAHGRDLDRSSVVETVRSFRLLKADGEIVNVSREENAELFSLVIGGYGLFGVILDADIELTDNEVYEQSSVVMDYAAFPAYFERKVKGNPDVVMMLCRPSFVAGTFLRELVVVTWRKTSRTRDDIFVLTQEKGVLRDTFVFGLSRKFDWAKSMRWDLQKKIETGVGHTRIMSRTNAMRPPLAPLEFLDYYSASNTDIIQEYYIPTRNYLPFMDAFREILLRNESNVISFTIRYVKANDETLMAYAPKEDAFAIIQMNNVGLSGAAQTQAERTTQEIVDAAIANDGTYYLTYQLYPSREQLRRAYPNADAFFAKKRKYDPDERFVNAFYEKYGR